jgi:hypothetical protein
VDDDQLTDDWEAGPLGRPVSHEDRVRIARVLIQRHCAAEAGERLARRIEANCEAAGVPERFDRELTLRWTARIADAIKQGGATTFDDLVALHPELVDPALLGLPEWLDRDEELRS